MKPQWIRNNQDDYDALALRCSVAVKDAELAWKEVESATAIAAVLFQAMVRKNMALRNLVEEGNSYREFSKDFPFRTELESALAECADVPAIDDPSALLEHVRAAARAEGVKAERERCIRLCNGVADSGDFTEGAAEACAHAIRADWGDK